MSLWLLIVVVGKCCEVRPHLVNVKVRPSRVHGRVVPQRPPHCAVALEARAKAHLPDPVPTLNTTNALNIGKDVPTIWIKEVMKGLDGKF